jgi:adhesin transport system outer membrane protein
MWKLIFLSLIGSSLSHALTLEQSIHETVQHNPDILVTQKDHRAIQEALKEAQAAYLPKLKVNLGYGIENDRNVNTQTLPDPSPNMAPREATLTLDQMVFDGFATKWDVARNTARVDSAGYRIVATINDTVQRNVEVYMNVLREKELVQLAQQNLTFYETILRMIELRTKSGVSRMADLYQARGRTSLARSNLLAESSNLKDAQANFYRVTGLAPENLSLPAHPKRRYLPASAMEAISIALKNNPVIKTADADINAAIAQHNFAYAANYPRFDIQVAANRNRNVNGVRGPTFSEYAKIRMSYNLYNGGADINKQQETAFQEQQAKDIRQRAVRQLIEAVKLTWDSLMTARGQLNWLKAHQREAEETVRAYAQEYQIGQRTLLDLLDSQNELFSAKRAYVQGRYEVLLSEYRILRDMGLSIAALNLSRAVALPVSG